MSAVSSMLFLAGMGADDPAALNQAIAVAGINHAKLTVVGVIDDVETIEAKVLAGKGFREVIREVHQYQHDLVVKRVGNVERTSPFLGNTDLNLLRHCPCPVWIVKSTQQHGFDTIVAAVDYDPEDQKVDELNGAILVMGTVGRTGIPGLVIGNTAEAILNQVHCSILAVKPPDFVSPVSEES